MVLFWSMPLQHAMQEATVVCSVLVNAPDLVLEELLERRIGATCSLQLLSTTLISVLML